MDQGAAGGHFPSGGAQAPRRRRRPGTGGRDEGSHPGASTAVPARPSSPPSSSDDRTDVAGKASHGQGGREDRSERTRACVSEGPQLANAARARTSPGQAGDLNHGHPDYYQTLGVARISFAGRDQEGLPQAGPPASPGRQASGDKTAEHLVQGRSTRLTRVLSEPGQAAEVRPGSASDWEAYERARAAAGRRLCAGRAGAGRAGGGGAGDSIRRGGPFAVAGFGGGGTSGGAPGPQGGVRYESPHVRRRGGDFSDFFRMMFGDADTAGGDGGACGRWLPPGRAWSGAEWGGVRGRGAASERGGSERPRDRGYRGAGVSMQPSTAPLGSSSVADRRLEVSIRRRRHRQPGRAHRQGPDGRDLVVVAAASQRLSSRRGADLSGDA